MLRGFGRDCQPRAAHSGSPWLRSSCVRASLLFIAALLGVDPVHAQTPPGVQIVNRAFVSHGPVSAQPTVVASNEVSVTTTVVRSQAAVELLRVTGIDNANGQRIGPASCPSSGASSAQAIGGISGTTAIDGLTPYEFSPAPSYNLGEAIIVRLADADQNIDYQTVDVAEVTLSIAESGDSEVLRLTETGPNTGVFTGYLPSANGGAVSNDCILQGRPDSLLEVGYVDPQDGADRSADTAMLDPSGVTFDSRSGSPVDGVRIALIDAVSGAPAAVTGNDGISAFPHEIVSGGQVTDASGQSYEFASGRFRFPTVPAGEYRLVVESPDGYIAPTRFTENDLQSLPGSPYLLSAGSFGNTFTQPVSGPLSIDFPLDSQDVSLFVQKSSLASSAAPGDFVRYDVSVGNGSTLDPALAVRVLDALPAGTRFVEGSATRDGAPIVDPESGTGNTLTFDLGDLSPGQQTSLSYVLEIVAGNAGDSLRNTATAVAAGGIASNEASATIRLTEDLFRSTSTLVGRVVEGSCALSSFAEDQGVAGVRVYLEDGRYAVTDAGGRFHFEGLQPGTHVAQLDPMTIPDYLDVVGCNANPRFAGRGDSQFVELSRGALQRADFYLTRKAPAEGTVDIAMQTRGTDTRDRVEYRIDLSGSGAVPVDGLRVTVMLPEGITYANQTIEIGRESADEPRLTGQAMTIELGDRSGNWSEQIQFYADIDPTVTGDLSTRAIAQFRTGGSETQRTPIAETLVRREAATWENTGYVLNLTFGILSAELSPADRDALDTLIDAWSGVRDIRITAIGHSDSTRISARSRKVFADNYVLSEARARSAAEYIAHALGVPADELMVEGRGPDDPIASNESTEGRQQNRRVELVLAGMRPGQQSFVDVPNGSSGTLVAETRGANPAESAAQAQLLDEAALEAHLTPPVQEEPSMATLTPGVDWVLPEDGFRPAIPALQISIKHAPNQTIALFANGLEVDPVQFIGKETTADGGITVSRWAGVPLLEGSNQLVADIIGENGLVAERLTRVVHFAGIPVRAEFDGEASLLVADGRTRPVLALRMFDRFGQPARHSSVGSFAVDAPYRSWWAVQDERQNKLVQITKREPLFTVGDDGIAYLELEPTTTSGEVTVRMSLEAQREQEIKAWLKPEAREWILVGFGEGTVGYNTLSNNAAPAGLEDGYFDDGRLAFFAKGSIKGEYLLTLAYDSARDRQQTRNGFATEIDPNAFYTLYGDNTEQRFEAASQRKLYVKLERGQFNALFGDYATGLNTAELARYERRMNGLRSEFAGQNFSYKVFASESDQTFVRDEVRGDGTSGLYRLSQGPIVALSESIRIETRDRFDQAEVVETRSLSRFLDYNLDPLDGTIYFKQPVPSRDESLNPLYIIAEYEVRGSGGDEVTAGGRVAMHSSDRRLELGVTAISEDQQLRGGELVGTDLRWQATDKTLVRAEIAASERETSSGAEEGNAKLLVVEHRSEKLDLRAELRETDQTYGLGLQSAAESGIRKLELDGRYAMSSDVTLHTELSRLDNLESGADRLTAQADVQYQTNVLSANVGYVFAEDTFADGEQRTSNVIDAGVSRRLFESALSVRANGSLSLSGDAESADYPASYVFGVDYEILPEVNLYLEYENAEGRDLDSELTRLGVRASPWSRANFTSSFSNEMTEFGPRLYSNLGFVQGFQLNERWVFDIGLDQTNTLRDPGLRVFDEDRDLASGTLNDDFMAGYLGALYQSDDWSINTRIEHRHADREQRTSFLSGWFREPAMGHGLSAGMTVFSSERDDGAEALAAELRFGWARRPAESPWTLFHQVDLGIEERTTTVADDTSWRIVSNFNLNRRISANSQLSLQYAAKFVRSDFDSLTVDGYSDLFGVDYRRGFADRWEISAQASVYQSHRAGTADYGTGLALGYALSDDMWISVGYNLSGFRDDDFAAARYTAAGPFLRISLRGHQALLKRVTGR